MIIELLGVWNIYSGIENNYKGEIYSNHGVSGDSGQQLEWSK